MPTPPIILGPLGPVPGTLTYTFAQLKESAMHALGKTPDDGMNFGDIVNDAVSYIAIMREWSWLRSTFSLGTTNGQNFVIMPSDFAQLVSIAVNQTIGLARIVTLQEILELRAAGTVAIVGAGFYVAFTTQGQAGDDALPIVQMEIYPTPSATTAGVFTGEYVRAPRRMVADTDLPDVPSPFHAVLKRLVRVIALEDDGQETEASAARVRVDQALQQLVERDSRLQPNLGRITGAVRRPGPRYRDTSIRPGETISPA